MVDLIRFGAKITGGNEIPPGSGSFVDPLSGILKDLESSKANFAESLSAATLWGAADLVSKMVDLVKIGKNPQPRPHVPLYVTPSGGILASSIYPRYYRGTTELRHLVLPRSCEQEEQEQAP